MKIYERASNYIKANGIKKSIWRLFQKIREKIFNNNKAKEEHLNYLKWIENNEPDEFELEKQKNFKFEFNPKISVIVPMYNTKERYFEELVESLKEQTYSNFELCLADGSDTKQDLIDKYIAGDERIKYKLLGKNTGISGNSNEGLKMATGEYIALLDHDDIIPKFSLFEIVKAINENMDAEFFYSDEDKLMEYKDKRMGPHFKSDFAIDTFRSYNYICHFSIFKKELIDRIGGFRSEYDGSQDYDIIFRAVTEASRIVHIPKILYHWRINADSVASSAAAKPYAYEAAKRAIKENLRVCNIEGGVIDSKVLGLYRVIYKYKGSPKCIKSNKISSDKYILGMQDNKWFIGVNKDTNSENVKKLLLTHFYPTIDKELYVDEAKEVFENTEAATEEKKLILRRNHENYNK